MNLTFELFTRKYHEDCHELLSDAFTRREPPEPLGCHITYESGAFQHLAEYYLRVAAKEGMSTVCVDQDTGKAVGIVVTEDLKVALEGNTELSAFMETLQTKFGDVFARVFHAFEVVEKPFLESINLDTEGNVWHMWMLGVDKEYGKLGIGSSLIRENLKMARDRGFAFAVADCTSSFSSKAFQKQGFKLHTRLKYKDYEFPPKSGNFPMREEYGEKPGFDSLDFMVNVLVDNKTG
mmetsp:Transcript_15419/g.27811  ORF Transcript_15419/g.27811 Transcript_15419/m.27811 type:complete len:236 (+) Transcript_15419:189-896(+)